MLEGLRNAQLLLGQVLADADLCARMIAAGHALAGCLSAGNKILACGNGGSACDAAHFVEELTGRFRADRPPLAALACTDPGHLTCTANDYGFDHVFSRWVEALGKPGDALVVLSTSGNSPNIVRAVEAGISRGLMTVALLGRGGGKLGGRCRHQIVVPGQTADRIQELHMLVLHGWCEMLETVQPPTCGGHLSR